MDSELDADQLAKLRELSKLLIKLNEKYHEYLYLKSFDDLEDKRDEVYSVFEIGKRNN